VPAIATIVGKANWWPAKIKPPPPRAAVRAQSSEESDIAAAATAIALLPAIDYDDATRDAGLTETEPVNTEPNDTEPTAAEQTDAEQPEAEQGSKKRRRLRWWKRG